MSNSRTPKEIYRGLKRFYKDAERIFNEKNQETYVDSIESCIRAAIHHKETVELRDKALALAAAEKALNDYKKAKKKKNQLNQNEAGKEPEDESLSEEFIESEDESNEESEIDEADKNSREKQLEKKYHKAKKEVAQVREDIALLKSRLLKSPFNRIKAFFRFKTHPWTERDAINKELKVLEGLDTVPDYESKIDNNHQVGSSSKLYNPADIQPRIDFLKERKKYLKRKIRIERLEKPEPSFFDKLLSAFELFKFFAGAADDSPLVFRRILPNLLSPTALDLTGGFLLGGIAVLSFPLIIISSCQKLYSLYQEYKEAKEKGQKVPQLAQEVLAEIGTLILALVGTGTAVITLIATIALAIAATGAVTAALAPLVPFLPVIIPVIFAIIGGIELTSNADSFDYSRIKEAEAASVITHKYDNWEGWKEHYDEILSPLEQISDNKNPLKEINTRYETIEGDDELKDFYEAREKRRAKERKTGFSFGQIILMVGVAVISGMGLVLAAPTAGLSLSLTILGIAGAVGGFGLKLTEMLDDHFDNTATDTIRGTVTASWDAVTSIFSNQPVQEQRPTYREGEGIKNGQTFNTREMAIAGIEIGQLAAGELKTHYTTQSSEDSDSEEEHFTPIPGEGEHYSSSASDDDEERYANLTAALVDSGAGVGKFTP